MKQKVIIKKDDSVLFKGKILNIPIKEDIIIKRSIEVFDDEDPCIIHQSYVIKDLCSELLDLFKKENKTSLDGATYEEALSFLNYEDIKKISIELVG